jgi:phosphonate transport system ATP-binding protein
VIEIDNLIKRFNGQPALDSVSLKVEAGERLAVLGPSGAGKTTLFRIINLALTANQGQFRFRGQETTGLSKAELKLMRRRIGTIYQQHNLVARLKVVHNVLAGRLAQWSLAKGLLSLVWPQELELARQALEKVGIAEKLFCRADNLSSGEQQRVAIARVLVQDPDLILADEPVSSVDPSRAHGILRLLIDISQASGKTLIASLHSVGLALEYFPRIVGIKQGRILFDRSTSQLEQDDLASLYELETSPCLSSQDEPAKRTDACRPLF